MTVSIVVASYNYGQYIGAALRSIQAQSHGDWEAIVVDDGSTDDSLEVIRPFLGDPRFRLIQNQHLGQPRTKNCGIRAARGDFIAFLDADDIWQPTKLDRQLSVFHAEPQVGLCYTRRTLIDPDGQVIGGDAREFHRGFVLDAIFRDNFVCFSSAMIRREVVDRVGMFDERFAIAIDYDWWLRVARDFAFDYVDEPLVRYRMGHANLSRRVGERLDTALAIMRQFVARDLPPQLSTAARTLAFAETYRHRGLIARQDRPLAGLGWVLRSLATAPTNASTWRALCTTMIPARLRSAMRRLRGDEQDWERRVA